MWVKLPKKVKGAILAEAIAKAAERAGLTCDLKTQQQYVPGSAKLEASHYAPTLVRPTPARSGILGFFQALGDSPPDRFHVEGSRCDAHPSIEGASGPAIFPHATYDHVELSWSTAVLSPGGFAYTTGGQTTDHAFPRLRPTLDTFVAALYEEIGRSNKNAFA